MKTRVLRVDGEPRTFAPLIEALAAAGLRCGWLDLTTPVEPPAALEAAAGLGAFRAVSAVGGRTVAVKPVKGSFVLRDLLREHFRGCHLVLVRGEVGAGVLRPAADGDEWVVGLGGDATQELSTAELVDKLRKPVAGG